MKKSINYLDLFSGIGGFALGLEQSGITIKRHFYSDIDPYANRIYKKHFPKAVGLGDVKTIKSFRKLGHIDLITFGFPCQDLSIAGKGKGFDGTRSCLFYEAIRIIRKIRPTHFIFENVKGLLSNDNGRTFEKVLQEIADIGLYDCEWQLVNTSWLLPQNRERIYFIGHLRGFSEPKVFPICGCDKKTIGVQRQTVNTITAQKRDSVGTYVIENKLVQETKRNAQGERIKSIYGNSVCLTSNGGGFATHTGLYAVPVLTPGRINKRQNGRRFKNIGDPSFTLTTQDRHGIMLVQKRQSIVDLGYEELMSLIQNGDLTIRRLSPLECERLQGFPDGWTESCSDNQRYKMLGNAVTVAITKLIFSRLYNE